MTTIREEHKNFERDVINKCKDETKLFFRYVNSKIKARKGIDKIRVDEVIYEDPKDIAQVMNFSFKEIFTNELKFERPLIEYAGMQGNGGYSNFN